MLTWLWRRLGFVGQETSDYDAIYGFPKKAIAEWLQWNPRLAAEHEVLEREAKYRRDEEMGKQG